MSDKPLVQQTLAREIAEIVLSIPRTSGSLAFLRGFWEATVREWSGIDHLRSVALFCRPVCTLRSLQHGQILHACPAIHKRVFPVADARKMGVVSMRRVQHHSDAKGRSVMVCQGHYVYGTCTTNLYLSVPKMLVKMSRTFPNRELFFVLHHKG